MKEYATLIKVVIILVVLGGIGSFIWQAFQWKEAAEQNAAAVEQRDNQAEATSAITTNLSGAQAEAQRLEIVVNDGRASYDRAVRSLETSDASVAAWRRAPVPDRLRALARERESYQYRSGNSEAGRGADDAGTRDSRQSPGE